jgi:hypothetical protein
MRENFQDSIIQDRARDFVYRLCLAGKNSWNEIFTEACKAGFADHLKGDGPLRKLIQPMLDSGELKRIDRGVYVACCTHCREPILNVMGMEH